MSTNTVFEYILIIKLELQKHGYTEYAHYQHCNYTLTNSMIICRSVKHMCSESSKCWYCSYIILT